MKLQLLDWLSTIYQHFVIFWTEDVRDILHLSAQALRNAKIPRSLDSFNALDGGEIVNSLPICTVLLFFSISVVYASYIIMRSTPGASACRSRGLTSAVIVRIMGFIYFFAFLTNAHQCLPLYGSNGLAPIVIDKQEGFKRPSPIFSYFGLSDFTLEVFSWLGVLFSAVMCLTPLNMKVNFLIPLFLWITYLSIINLGVGYIINYGWEWLTAEIGFLVIFLCPFINEEIPEVNTTIIFWLLRWSAFRLMFGAGMSKMGHGSSQCWKSLDCLSTHYETQPMPNPISFYFHHLPVWFHKIEGILVLIEQIILPFLLFSPNRIVTMFLCIAELILMSGIAGTGNYAWINVLGFLPFVSCLDDDFPLFLLYRRYSKSKIPEVGSTPSALSKQDSVPYRCIKALRVIISLILLTIITRLSVNPVKELFSNQPWLHFYDDYFLVNANGLFGFVNRERIVITLEFSTLDIGTLKRTPCKDTLQSIGHDYNNQKLFCRDIPDYCGKEPQVDSLCQSTCGVCFAKEASALAWTPIEFQNLPGSIDKRPKFNSPYHYRFDWEVWIHTTASMEGQKPSGWVPPFIRRAIGKLLFGDIGVRSLFFNADSIPSNITAIKSSYHRYKFSNESVFSTGTNWWERDTFSQSTRIWTKDSFTGQGLTDRLKAVSDLGVKEHDEKNGDKYQALVLSLVAVYLGIVYIA